MRNSIQDIGLTECRIIASLLLEREK